MIDPAAYRRAEHAAIEAKSGRVAAEAMGVPREHAWIDVERFADRVESLADLAPIADRLQEGRWDRFQRELGGLTDGDTGLLVAVLADYARMASRLFSTHAVALPLDTAMAMLALYRKLSWRPCADVLEVGPGSGLLSFFLARHAGLRTYHQVEVTESLYLLQSAVNDAAFGAGHYEQVTEAPPYDPMDIQMRAEPGCYHWPWWKISSLEKCKFGLDLIVFSANLCEMTPEARAGYLALAKASLRPGGAIVVQCYGAEYQGTQDAVRQEICVRTGLRELFYRSDGPPGDAFLTAAGVYGTRGAEFTTDLVLYGQRWAEEKHEITKADIVGAVRAALAGDG